jgi:hypothetical protein
MPFAPSRQIAATKAVKIRTLMASADFVAGFNEVRKGKPFNYDREHKTDSWFYERGRQLAMIYDGPLKEGHTVVPPAIEAYYVARRSGVIV